MQYAPISGRNFPYVTPETINRISDLVKSEARYTVYQIASIVSISLGSTRNILRNSLKVGRMKTGWVPHLLNP